MLYLEQSYLNGNFREYEAAPSDTMSLHKYGDDSCVLHLGGRRYDLIWTTTALVGQDGIYPYRIDGRRFIVDWNGDELVFGPEKVAVAQPAKVSSGKSSPLEKVLHGKWVTSGIVIDGQTYTDKSLLSPLDLRLTISDDLLVYQINGQTTYYSWRLNGDSIEIVDTTEGKDRVVWTMEYDGTTLHLHVDEAVVLLTREH